MRKLLADMPVFVEVARHKSFTLAADVLDMPIATLSRRIAAMEKELGIPLLHRTTRSVELTEGGRAFYNRCEFIVNEAERAKDDLVSEQQNPVGRLRVSLPATAYFLYMRGALRSFLERYPEIELHAHFAARWVDLNTEPFDLEIRTGAMPDSNLVARKLATIEPGLYASPALLERFPTPRTPEDLQVLPYISMVTPGTFPTELRKGDETRRLNLRPAHVVNSPLLALELAMAGFGTAGLAVSVAREYEACGKLIRLIPEWRFPGVDISLVMASSQQPHRVRLFVDHLVEHFAALPK